MTTNDLVIRDRPSDVSLFAGATAGDVLRAATDAADTLRPVIEQQKLAIRIRDREHVLNEGWQTLGALTGVAAVKDGGTVQLPWPAEMIELPDEPPEAGREPRRASPEYPAWQQADTLRRAWEQHRDLLGARNRGLAYGFSVSWKAMKNGVEVGWGEGRCTRAEKAWSTRDDYALASQASTRGQSRALAAPLRFVVKLAGYSGTPADEMPADEGAPAAPAAPYGAEVDEAAQRKVAADVQAMFPGIDGPTFVKFVTDQFGTDRLPEASARMVAAIRWAIGRPEMTGNQAQAPADEAIEGTSTEETDDDGN